MLDPLSISSSPSPVTTTGCNDNEIIANLTKVADLVQNECEPISFEPFLPSQKMIADEIESLRGLQLSEAMSEWVDRYSQVGDRHSFLWTWCRRGVEITTLSSVQTDLFDYLCDTKVLGVMFDVLLDDVADQGGDIDLLDRMACIPSRFSNDWSEFDDRDQAYARCAEAVWNEVKNRVRELPRYEEFKRILHYDYTQLLNTMGYAHLLNHFPSMLNLAEHDLYLPHNMHMMVSATIDLMASPDFDFEELGRLREAIWHAQYMGRIGNLITTWQREVGEGDFTSGVFAHAVTYGNVSPQDLRRAELSDIEDMVRRGGHEEYFLDRWQSHRRFLIEQQQKLKSIDLTPLVHGLERLICLHLGSRGLK